MAAMLEQRAGGTNTEGFVKALNDANYGGYSNWRMPNSKELASIVNYGIPYPGPTIDTGYFQNTAASWYWSSTTNVYNTNYAWVVNFGYGSVNNSNKNNAGYVRAVRGGQSASFANLVISPTSRKVTKDCLLYTSPSPRD